MLVFQLSEQNLMCLIQTVLELVFLCDFFIKVALLANILNTHSFITEILKNYWHM